MVQQPSRRETPTRILSKTQKLVKSLTFRLAIQFLYTGLVRLHQYRPAENRLGIQWLQQLTVNINNNLYTLNFLFFLLHDLNLTVTLMLAFRMTTRLVMIK